jgi:hypothetical protein
MSVVTPERLRELLAYDPGTGVFTRLVSTSSRANAGRVAGSLNGKGHRQTRIDGRNYQDHRRAWLYVHGAWPVADLDHINMDRADNRITNLRVATKSQNQANRPAQANNTSGFKGVTWNKRRGNWMAQIAGGGKNKYLGYFDTAEAAHAEYCAAARKYHGDFARAV